MSGALRFAPAQYARVSFVVVYNIYVSDLALQRALVGHMRKDCDFRKRSCTPERIDEFGMVRMSVHAVLLVGQLCHYSGYIALRRHFFAHYYWNFLSMPRSSLYSASLIYSTRSIDEKKIILCTRINCETMKLMGSDSNEENFKDSKDILKLSVISSIRSYLLQFRLIEFLEREKTIPSITALLEQIDQKYGNSLRTSGVAHVIR